MSDEAGAHGDPDWRERELERLKTDPRDKLGTQRQLSWWAETLIVLTLLAVVAACMIVILTR